MRKSLLLLFLTILPITVSADGIMIDGLSYEFNSDKMTASVIGYDKEENIERDVIIPNYVEYEGQSYTVTGIDPFSFSWYYNVEELLTSVVLPNHLMSIANDAFRGQSNLTSIIIPKSICELGDDAFVECDALTSFTIKRNKPLPISADFFPNRFQAILYVPYGSESAYASADYWKDFKEIRGSFEATNEFLEFDNLAIKNVCLDNWDYNHDCEFDYTEAAKVTDIGTVFNYLGLKTIDFLQYFTGLKSIGKYAFSGNELESIILPEGLLNIDTRAFSGEGNLRSVTFPNSLQTIGDYAFCWCGFTNLTLPDNVTNIGEGAFWYCYELTSVTLPQHLEVIGTSAFADCQKLTEIIIPDHVVTINDWAFDQCTSLSSVVIGSSVTSIGWSAFGNCPLTSATIRVEDPLFTSLGEDVNEDVTLYVPRGTMIKYKNKFTHFTNIEEYWEGEPDDGDYFCSKNQEGVIILYQVLSAENKTCQVGNGNAESPSVILPENYHDLEMLTIPETVKGYTVTAIADYAIHNLYWVNGITIPKYVNSIGEHTFDYGITVKSKITVPFATDAFNDSWGTLYVPAGTKAQYLETTSWNSFSSIIELYEDPDLFPDCPEGELRDAAMYLYNLGIIQGEHGMLLPNREISRAELAKITFYGVYHGYDKVPDVIPSDIFPSVYEDLKDEDTYYYRAAKALLYLEFGDGITPFDRNRLDYEPTEKISRINVLKVLLEAFNIWTYNESTNPFPQDEDVVSLATNNPQKMGYLNTAYSEGWVNTSNEYFRPYDKCTRGEAFLFLARIMQTYHESSHYSYSVPEEADFFQPLNTTLKTVGLGVGLQMGNFRHYTKTSFSLSGVVPLVFAHTYNSYNTTLPSVFFGDKGSTEADESYQPLGEGWSHNYHSFITVVGEYSSGTPDNGLRAIVHWGGGSIDVYKYENGQFVPESMGIYESFTYENGEVLIKSKSQMEYRFSMQDGTETGVLYLYSVKDRNGNELSINYENGQNGSKRISSVSDGHRELKFSYLSGTDLLSEVKDPLNRSISFTYFDNKQTGKKQLESFTDAEGNTTTYEYADLNSAGASKLLKRIQLPKGNYVENEYDQNRRLSQTVRGLNGVPTTKTSVTVAADYRYGMASTSSEVVVERGSQTSAYQYTYNENNVVTNVTSEMGMFINRSYENVSHPELPTAIESNKTDVSDISYDERGNVTSITIIGDGTLTTQMTYDEMNNLTSVTDPKGNTTTYSYDEKGNLTGVSAPEGVTSSITVDGKGLPTEVLNPMGIKKEYEYNEYGNLTKYTLPALGLSSSAAYDAASRMTSVTDALDRTSSYEYNNNDFLKSETDAMDHTTRYAYDENSNLTSITNAKGGVTTMTYDNATDWLLSVEFAGARKQYDYNKDGTLSSFTKPDGTTLSYSYDELAASPVTV